MRRILNSFSLALSLLLMAAAGQQMAAQVKAPVVQESLAALSGGMAVHDVTLSGHVNRHGGSDEDTGTAIFTAMASGETRMDFSVSSGQQSEVYARGPRGMAGQWNGPDQKAHKISEHNLLADPTWFSPVLVLQRAANLSELVVTQMAVKASAKANGKAPIEHLRVMRNPASPQNPALNSALNAVTRKVQNAIWDAAQIDLYLDPATHLPFEMDFNTHPDNNVGENIPVRVVYSDYRPVNGSRIPFHLQKYMNGNLMLDVRLDSATLNSGLAASSFAVTTDSSRGVAQ